ncbi:MAG TPA: AMP-binding protein, partial [Gammaproteobacteria bacterium]|nr:AMP-binding protein [Gammaproteobacteria bacterium]
METPTNDSQMIQKHLLNLVHTFLLSLEKKRAADILNLDSKISSELGIDSLGRVELFHQIEDKFGIYLPENLLAEAETIRDIFNRIEQEDYSKDLIIGTQELHFTETTINPLHFKTLVEVLLKRGAKEPTRVHIYYQDEKGHSHPITYGELLKSSLRVASNLQAWGFRKGETVAIMLPTCPEFFYTFMGIMLAGLIPVPIYPPFRPDKLEEYALRESIILKNAEVRLMVTFYAAEKLASLLKVFIPNLKKVVTAHALLQGEEKFAHVALKGSSPAFIQYTSGSTSDPKGV